MAPLRPGGTALTPDLVLDTHPDIVEALETAKKSPKDVILQNATAVKVEELRRMLAFQQEHLSM